MNKWRKERHRKNCTNFETLIYIVQLYIRCIYMHNLNSEDLDWSIYIHHFRIQFSRHWIKIDFRGRQSFGEHIFFWFWLKKYFHPKTHFYFIISFLYIFKNYIFTGRYINNGCISLYNISPCVFLYLPHHFWYWHIQWQTWQSKGINWWGNLHKVSAKRKTEKLSDQSFHQQKVKMLQHISLAVIR